MKKLTYKELQAANKRLDFALQGAKAKWDYWEDAYNKVAEKNGVLASQLNNGRRVSEIIRMLLGKNPEEFNQAPDSKLYVAK